ncbi:MAG: hypothetical protein EBV14_02975 [Actinobacteria bacterium]|nr:hypothetical protein [Actinomycetota bacterium]
MPYRSWQKLNKPILFVVLGLNALPFTPLGVSVNGAHAWVAMGPIRFQPSELLKFALIIYLTNNLGRRQRDLTDFKRTFQPALFAWVVAAGFAMAQRDLGAAVVLSGIAFTVLYMAGSPVRWIVVSAIGASMAGLLYIATSASRLSRWTAFLDIEGNKEHSGYQVWQSMLSISNGGIFGVGPGAGTSKWGYVRVLCPHVLRLRRRDAGTRLFRRVARGRHHGVVCSAGDDQHRRCCRCDACDRTYASAHLVRRQFAAHHVVGGGLVAERRAKDSLTPR